MRAAISVALAAHAAHGGDPPSEADIGARMFALGLTLGAMTPAGLARLDQKLAVAEDE